MRAGTEEEAEAKRRRVRESKWEIAASGLPDTVVSLDQTTLQRNTAMELQRLQGMSRTGTDRSGRPRVYVGNCDQEVTEQEIMTLFSNFGQVTGIDMPREGGRGLGYCLVEFNDQTMANRAIATLQNFQLGGRTIRVSSETQQRRAPFGLKGALAVPAPALGPQSGLTFKNKPPDPPVDPGPKKPLHVFKPGEASGSRAAQGAAVELRRLTVSGIPSLMEAKDIIRFMEAYGQVVRCDPLAPATSTHPQRFANERTFAGRVLVEYASESSAYIALKGLQSKALGGGTLHIHLGSPGGGSREIIASPALASVADIASVEPPLPTKEEREEEDKPPELIASLKAATVLLLENMVPPGEADDDLEEEVKEECENFGAVERVKVSVVGQKKVVQILVYFKTTSARQKAEGNLNGRWFAGRQVKATPYVEEDIL